jgi:transcriptional regulator with XRE-family HTH domain
MDEKVIYKLVGGRIRKMREQKWMTQEALAAELGASRASIANYESGKQSVYLSDLYRMADILKVKVADFLPALDEVRTRSAPDLLLEKGKDLEGHEKKQFRAFIDELKRRRQS